ncbi:MAG: hypothetical protein KTR24_09220 [Saprospiraceae bacterium]|nr:hypothetical protein [Saprospiraceae bacterium]
MLARGSIAVSLLGFLLSLYFSPEAEEHFSSKGLIDSSCKCALVFREIDERLLYGESAGFLADEVPGLDHVALLVNGKVYENHPGYGRGDYLGEGACLEVENIGGIQWQHTLGTFTKYQHGKNQSVVKKIAFNPISCDLAKAMETFIVQSVDVPYGFFDYSFADISRILSPSGQKGAFGSFTCSGLIEAAAEEAGYRQGEGFVPNHRESFTIPNPWSMLPLVQVPLLRPGLIHYYADR